MPMKSRLCAMPVPPSTGYMSAWTNGSAPAAPNAKSAPTLAAQSSTKVTNTSTSSFSVPARTAPRHIMRSPTASSKEATRWSSTSAAPIRPATAPTPPATISPGERRRSPTWMPTACCSRHNQRSGHGIGQETHEEPYIIEGNVRELEPGMAFSIEPGIYFDGHFGARIEDIVVCTESGIECLNNQPRELVVLD